MTRARAQRRDPRVGVFALRDTRSPPIPLHFRSIGATIRRSISVLSRSFMAERSSPSSPSAPSRVILSRSAAFSSLGDRVELLHRDPPRHFDKSRGASSSAGKPVGHSRRRRYRHKRQVRASPSGVIVITRESRWTRRESYRIAAPTNVSIAK